MNPASYVLLLVSCWLLLASALLWGMLRIARRHYEIPRTEPAEPQRPLEPIASRSHQTPAFQIQERPQSDPVAFARSFCFPRRPRCQHPGV